MAILKKLFWYSIAVLLVGYIIYSYFEKEARDNARYEAIKKEKQETVATIKQKIKRHHAVVDWPVTLLNGEKTRIGTILSIELEKLWIGDRPIFFLGSIEDVSSLDKQYYTVVIDRGSPASWRTGMFATDLKLKLKCQRPLIDLFLKGHPDIFKRFGFNNSVGVIAKIVKIKADSKIEKDDNVTEIRTGVGACLDVIYTGSIDLSDIMTTTQKMELAK